MEVTAPGRMFTHAARRSWTTSRAIRFASMSLPHVTRTRYLSVKESSRPVTLSLPRHFQGISRLHGRLQYLPGAGNILLTKGPSCNCVQKTNGGDDKIRNFRLARDYRGRIYVRECSPGRSGNRGARAKPQGKPDVNRRT